MSQKNTKLIFVGVLVSPAPLKADVETIHQPYTKYENESIRSHSAPTAITFASLVKIPFKDLL